MRIAVASQNFRTVTGHAGKTRRFLIFDIAPDGTAQEVNRLDLPKEMSIHEFADTGPHPLYEVDAVIAGSAGAGFVRRMASRNIAAVATAETDPAAAAAAFAAGRLAPALPHEHDDHHHDHDHGEDGCDCSSSH